MSTWKSYATFSFGHCANNQFPGKLIPCEWINEYAYMQHVARVNSKVEKNKRNFALSKALDRKVNIKNQNRQREREIESESETNKKTKIFFKDEREEKKTEINNSHCHRSAVGLTRFSSFSFEVSYFYKFFLLLLSSSLAASFNFSSCVCAVEIKQEKMHGIHHVSHYFNSKTARNPAHGAQQRKTCKAQLMQWLASIAP